MADDSTGTGPKDDGPKDGDPAPKDGAPTNGPTDGSGTDGSGEDSGKDGSGDAGKDGGNGSGSDDDPRVKRANGQAAESRRKYQDEKTRREQIESELEEAKKAAEERDGLKEFVEGLRKYMDPNAKDDEPADPEKLLADFESERNGWTSEREQLQAENRQLRVEGALPGLLDDAKLDHGLALAVLRSEGTLAQLDPAADDFQEKTKAAVDKLAEDHPRLKVTREGPRRSGTEHTGSDGGSDQLTYEQYKKLSPDEAVKAQRDGKLRKLLGSS